MTLMAFVFMVFPHCVTLNVVVKKTEGKVLPLEGRKVQLLTEDCWIKSC
jgi:hypothetical protein